MMQHLSSIFSRSESNGDYLNLSTDESTTAPTVIKSRERRPVGLLIATIFVVAGMIIGFLASIFFTHNSHTQKVYSNPAVPLKILDKVFVYNQTFGSGPIKVPESEIFWSSIVPRGRGTVEYPHGSRKFYSLSALHQLHCLWDIRRTVYSMRNDSHVDERHIRHCFDYLRQSFMCAADTTLESVDPLLGGVTGWDAQTSCRDYNQLFEWAENYRASNEKGFMDGDHHH